MCPMMRSASSWARARRSWSRARPAARWRCSLRAAVRISMLLSASQAMGSSVGPAERKVNVILKYALSSVLLFRRGVVCGKQRKVSVRMEELNSMVPSDRGDQEVGGRNRYAAFPTVSCEFDGSGPDIRRSRYRIESIEDSLQLCAFGFSPRTVPQLENDHVAQHRPAAAEEIRNRVANLQVTVGSESLDPRRCVDERHCAVRLRSRSFRSMKSEKVPRISVNAADLRIRTYASRTAVTASLFERLFESAFTSRSSSSETSILVSISLPPQAPEAPDKVGLLRLASYDYSIGPGEGKVNCATVVLGRIDRSGVW